MNYNNESNILQPSNPVTTQANKANLTMSPETLYEKEKHLKDAFFDIGDIKTGENCEHTLDAPVELIRCLNLRPGDTAFVFWFYVSSYFPIISACIGPVTNMLSIVAFIEHWRIDKVTMQLVTEARYLVALNGLSLAFGIVANIFLVLNFSKAFHYMLSQCISISCWLLASVLLLVTVIQVNKDTIGQDAEYLRSDGFWYGVFSTGFHFLCAVILSINLLGYLIGMYPASFNLTRQQRSLMWYTISLSVWLVVGAGASQELLPDISTGEALYFSTVTALTIGFGDMVPITTNARIFVLIFTFFGVLNMGLIVATIRQVVMFSSGPTIFWHLLEVIRKRTVRKINQKNIQMSSDEAFNEIRQIRRRAKRIQLQISLVIMLTLFLTLVFVGTTVFFFTEGWDYFESFYFCFLSLFTLGYGDYAPKSALGRVFFVSWGLSAVPMMTIIFSSLGDMLYDLSLQISEGCRLTTVVRLWKATKDKIFLRSSEDDIQVEAVVEKSGLEQGDEESNLEGNLPTLTSSSAQSQNLESGHNIITNVNKYDNIIYDEKQVSSDGRPFDELNTNVKQYLMQQKSIASDIISIALLLKPLIADSRELPETKYNHEQWIKYSLCSEFYGKVPNIDPESLWNEIDVESFWLSNKSPLRLPVNEPNFLVSMLLNRIEHSVDELLGHEAKLLKNMQSLRLDGNKDT